MLENEPIKIFTPIYLTKDIINTILSLKLSMNNNFKLIGIFCPILETINEENSINKISKILNIDLISIKDLNIIKNNEILSNNFYEKCFKNKETLIYYLKFQYQLKLLEKWAINEQKIVYFIER